MNGAKHPSHNCQQALWFVRLIRFGTENLTFWMMFPSPKLKNQIAGVSRFTLFTLFQLWWTSVDFFGRDILSNSRPTFYSSEERFQQIIFRCIKNDTLYDILSASFVLVRGIRRWWWCFCWLLQKKKIHRKVTNWKQDQFEEFRF